MNRRLIVVVIAAALGVVATARAHEVTSGDLVIAHPRLIVPSGKATSGHVVATVVNNGENAEILEAVRCVADDCAPGTDGPIATIPAGGKTRLGPDGATVRLTELAGPHFDEATVRLVLDFAEAGEVIVDAIVQIRSEGE